MDTDIDMDMDMVRVGVRRFPIRFDPWYRVFSSVVLVPPSSSYLDVTTDEVLVRMSWLFRTRFPIAAVARMDVLDSRPLSRGVHGWAGRWLVNGSGGGILVMELTPTQRGWVAGFPVRLRQLMVSLEEPAVLCDLLVSSTAGR